MPDASQTPVETRRYATQIEAPVPDYRQLIRDMTIVEFSDLRREATARAPADAKAVGEQWLARLNERGVVDGYGLSGKNDDDPISSFSLTLTPADFDAWVRENGWSVPRHIDWNFVPDLVSPRVSDAAAQGIRIWPASEARTGMQNQAADSGRIVLRDGCFYLDRQGVETLAWFHAETGLDVDGEGFYVLVNRMTGQVEGRLGETFVWAAPNPITPGGPSMEEFRAACGDGEISTVGNPTSTARMDAMYPPVRAPDAAPPPGIH
ncbi:hypothetical protein AAW00_02630 [Aurantiacibacter luteus]|uniref:Uncharacterized protein n=1 Tax=Aurantiacibacter luteus TaxID=1581420 RepID=A0A0G9MXD7_9SPHN|nr:hypothetical protein AAW00_02630 [Aurantiacibacter luteus]